MGTNIIDAFVVTFGLDASNFKKHASEVDDISKKTGEKATKAFGDIEESGKSLGVAFRGLRNEALGLFLAFTGAKDLGGFVANMLTSSASADRFGQTIGMATGKVIAWRQAIRSVGGHAGSADAALGGIAKMQQDLLITGNPGGHRADLIGLGVSMNDMRDKSPGQILEQLAQARSYMDPRQYANRLQRLGLPQDMIFLLEQGGDRVSKLISAYEKNTAQYEKQAQAAEKLQTALSSLEATMSKDLAPVATRIANFLNELLGHLNPKKASDPIGFLGGNAYDYLGKYLKENGWGKTGEWIEQHMGSGQAKGSSLTATNAGSSASAQKGISATLANRNNNPGNIRDGAFARAQAGYIGSDEGYAKFATAQDGRKAMMALLDSYVARGYDTISAIVKRWAPPSENDTGAYISDVSKQTGIGRGQKLSQQQLAMVASAMARHEGFKSQTVNVGTVVVHTRATDADGIARGIHSSLRKRSIMRSADNGVAS